MILLDTDVMIDILRQYPPALAWLGSLGKREIVLPGFVIMELIQGCRNKGEQAKVERELGAYSTAWPSPETCDEALYIFARYHLSHGLGMLDALIGQIAVDLNLPLYTFNQKHYAAIPNLKAVQPYERAANE
ncbi:type II toxin-antitoxin system VapC family toxin [Candidatus Poribacteria bacterium]|nr:type II toxin-antitoxin system VapC family toxin [Candidatus Poribacteria bacterium]